MNKNSMCVWGWGRRNWCARMEWRGTVCFKGTSALNGKARAKLLHRIVMLAQAVQQIVGRKTRKHRFYHMVKATGASMERCFPLLVYHRYLAPRCILNCSICNSNKYRWYSLWASHSSPTKDLAFIWMFWGWESSDFQSEVEVPLCLGDL